MEIVDFFWFQIGKKNPLKPVDIEYLSNLTDEKEIRLFNSIPQLKNIQLIFFFVLSSCFSIIFIFICFKHRFQWTKSEKVRGLMISSLLLVIHLSIIIKSSSGSTFIFGGLPTAIKPTEFHNNYYFFIKIALRNGSIT